MRPLRGVRLRAVLFAPAQITFYNAPSLVRVQDRSRPMKKARISGQALKLSAKNALRVNRLWALCKPSFTTGERKEMYDGRSDETRCIGLVCGEDSVSRLPPFRSVHQSASQREESTRAHSSSVINFPTSGESKIRARECGNVTCAWTRASPLRGVVHQEMPLRHGGGRRRAEDGEPRHAHRRVSAAVLQAIQLRQGHAVQHGDDLRG